MLDVSENEVSMFTAAADSKLSCLGTVKETLTEIAGKFIENHIGINVVELYNEF